MKATLLIALATALVAISTNASAEFMFGAEVGSSSTTMESSAPTGTGITYAGTNGDKYDEERNDDSFGVFVQYGYTIDRLTLAIHAGYGYESTDFFFDNRNFEADVSNALGLDGSDDYSLDDVGGELDKSADLLGVVKYRWGKVRPYLMYGFSQMSVDVEGRFFDDNGGGTNYESSDSITLKGTKLALGLEFPLGENAVGRIQWHKANYDDEPFKIGGIKAGEIGGDQSGVRLGIAYVF